MKKIFIYFFFLLSVVIFGSCKKDTDLAQPISLTINISVDPEIGFDLPLEGTKVKIVNKSNNSEYSALADASGKVLFENITPGLYNLNASHVISAVDYSALSGVYTTEDVNLNYAADNNGFYDDTNLNISLIANAPIGDWVFKQIYYSGSNTSTGASFRDAFIEIYNNSNEVQYADSLYFAVLTGKNNKTAGDYLLPNFQFDWSQSLNMNAIGDANNDYVYAKYFFKIPSDATGKKYPVLPGNSITIASSALNHTKPYTNNASKEVSGGDPNLTIDLSNADFEVYLQDYRQLLNPGSNPFATDIDNISVPNLDIVFSDLTTDLVLDATGRDAYVIMKVPAGENPANWPKYAYPTTRSITSSTSLYPQIPTKYILDAVQIKHPIETSVVPPKLPITLDAGATNVPNGQYSSQSLVRKTKKTVNGRKILQDTNNSVNDFGFLNLANPHKGAASFLD